MVRCKFVQKSFETENCESKGISRSRRLHFNVLGRSGDSASLKLGLKFAVPPGGKNEVSPSEDVSGEHHADNDLEQEDELIERLKVGSEKQGGDGGGGGDGLL